MNNLSVGELIDELKKFPYYYRMKVGRYAGDFSNETIPCEINKIVQGDPDHHGFQDIVTIVVDD